MKLFCISYWIRSEGIFHLPVPLSSETRGTVRNVYSGTNGQLIIQRVFNEMSGLPFYCAVCSKWCYVKGYCAICGTPIHNNSDQADPGTRKLWRELRLATDSNWNVRRFLTESRHSRQRCNNPCPLLILIISLKVINSPWLRWIQSWPNRRLQNDLFVKYFLQPQTKINIFGVDQRSPGDSILQSKSHHDFC